MKITKEEIIAFRCPRFNELPDVELYMDQVVGMIDKKLAALTDGEDEHIVTSTMINNYVKQKLIAPPVRKKYDRSHIAQLIVILISKRVLSINEIKRFIDRMNNADNFSLMYDRFCEQTDAILKVTFDSTTEGMMKFIETSGSGYGTAEVSEELRDDDDRLEMVIRAVALSFSCKLFAQYMLEEKKEKPQKKDKEQNSK